MKSVLTSLDISQPANQKLEQLVEVAAQRLQNGEAVEIDQLVAAHPEYADELRELLPAVEMLARLGDAPPVRTNAAGASNGKPSTLLHEQLGDFRLIREIGRGGMGVVYEAEQMSLGRRVALKVLPFAAVLDNRQLQRFRTEARAAASLHHTNIVPVFSVGCERGVHYYAMQFIDGQSLAEVVRDLRLLAGLEVPAEATGRVVGAITSQYVEGRFAPPIKGSPGNDECRNPNDEPNPNDECRNPNLEATQAQGTPSKDSPPAPVVARRSLGRGNDDHLNPNDEATPIQGTPVRDPSDIDVPARRSLGLASSLTKDEASPAPSPLNSSRITHHSSLPPDTLREPRALLSTDPATNRHEHFRSVARLGIQAAEGLEHAHREGVLHRDIKPANLLLDAKGNLWITDFGLARIGADSGMTMTGDIVGTLRYMSPEQVMAKRVTIAERSDIYSLGVTLYELLTLHPATSGQDREAVLKQIAFGEPTRPRRLNKAIPADLETVLLKAITKDPAERYAPAQALADDLRSYLDDRPIAAKRPGPLKRTVKWVRRHKLATGGLTIIAACLLAAVGFAVLAHDRGAQARQALIDFHTERGLRYSYGQLPDYPPFVGESTGNEHEPGLTVSQDQRYALAIAAFSSALKLDPRSAKLYLYRGSAYHRWGRHEEALANLHQSLALQPRNNPAPHDLIGQIERARGNTAEADRHAALGLQERPQTIEEMVTQARALGGEQGVRLMDQVIKREPYEPRHYRVRGELLMDVPKAHSDLELIDRALADLDTAYRGLPQDKGLFFFLCNMLRGRSEHCQKLGIDRGQTVARLKQLLIAPWPFELSDNHRYIELGLCRQQTGDFAGAIDVYTNWIAIHPNDAFPYHQRGWCYQQLGNRLQAIADYTRAIELEPTNAFMGLNNRAQNYIAVAEFSKALADIDQALTLVAAYCQAHQLEPNHWRASCHTLRGNALRGLKRSEEAIAAFTAAIDLEPKNPKYYGYRGGHYSYSRQFELAVTDYSKAIELAPQDAGLHSNRACCYWSMNQLDLALVDLNRALELEPDMVEAYNNRAAVHGSLGHFAEAVADFEKTLALRPGNPAAQLNYAALLVTCADRRFWDPTRAAELAQQELDGFDPKLIHTADGGHRAVGGWTWLGIARYRLGQYEAALAALDKALEMRTERGDEQGPSVSILFFQAMTRWQLGDQAAATKWYADAVAAMSATKSREDLHRHRAEAAELMGLEIPAAEEKPATDEKPTTDQSP